MNKFIAHKLKLKTYKLLIISFLVTFSFNSANTFATTILFNIIDGPGEGLNDTTAVSPVGGNNGLTLGQQRLLVFEYAAALLEQIINSNIDITIDARFDPLTPCSPSSGVIGSAGPQGFHRNFFGAPSINTWYPQALANSLSGNDQSGANDIVMTFNSDVDNNNSCLNNRSFYYGLDGNPGPDIDFLTTVLHEMIHGLGFLTVVNLSTGEKNGGFNDTFMVNLEDHSLNDEWGDSSMSNAERAASATDDPDLHWTGTNVDANSGVLSAGTNQGHVRMHAPSSLVLGSSVSHFSSAASPFELMEPSQTEPAENIGLARYLLQDIGWSIDSSNNPIISDINDISTDSSSTSAVTFAVMDNDTNSSTLSVSASSSNQSIISDVNLVTSGSGRIRQLDITPTSSTSGIVTITLIVSDGINNNSTDFLVNVTSNLAPTVSISSPIDGTVFYSSPQTFSATASDPEQGDLSSTVAWSSSINGSLSSGATINPSLSDGAHQIIASVTDNGSNNDTDMINITVDLNGDADGDGLINQLEISLGTNPENSDSDGDSLSDFNEVNMDSDPNNYTPGIDTDPNNPDTDGDGSIDGIDSAPLDPNISTVTVTAAPLWALIVAAILFITTAYRRKIKLKLF